MKLPKAPPFISSYPTGRMNVAGWHLRGVTRDATEYVGPFRPNAAKKVGAIIVPTSRKVSSIEKYLRHALDVAQQLGLPLVVLCSKRSNSRDFAALADTYDKLSWVAIDGPFTGRDMVGFKFSCNESPLSLRKTMDLSAKRNFGLNFAKHMGWETVLFVDDDIVLTADYVTKVANLHRDGAALIASNTREYPDNSVVLGAYRETYDRLDNFINSNSLLVKIDEAVGFYPRIYNEDWLFIIPYIIKNRDIVWAGSVKQKKYNPFEKMRALEEEPGDLLAEGLMRLVVDIIKSARPDDTYEALLENLQRRADKAFWEREILQRAVLIQDLLKNISSLSLHPIKARRMRASLKESLFALLGDGVREGLSADALVAWVHAWMIDLNRWMSYKPKAAKHTKLGGVLRELKLTSRSLYNEVPGVSLRPQFTDASGASKDHLSSLPIKNRSTAHQKGIASTHKLAMYMERKQLSLKRIVDMADRLRYDRPVRSLTGNKPVGTIAIVVHAFENPDTVSNGVKEILSLNAKESPLHCIVWISPGVGHRQRELKAYREYITARLMFETAGSNVRLLSCIARTPTSNLHEHIEELARTIGLAYWKNAIDSVDHPLHVVNSMNEVLSSGTVSDYLQANNTTSTKSLKRYFAELYSVPTLARLQSPDDYFAAARLRKRFLRNTLTTQTKFLEWRLTHSYRPTSLLAKSMKRAGKSLVDIDDQNYNLLIHGSHQIDIVANVHNVICLPVYEDDSVQYIRSALEFVLRNATRGRKRTGRTIEVMLAICGSGEFKDLIVKRKRIVEDVVTLFEMPAGVYLTSTIVANMPENVEKEAIRQCEALIRYEHWLENHYAKIKLEWLTTNHLKAAMAIRSMRSLNAIAKLSFLPGSPFRRI